MFAKEVLAEDEEGGEEEGREGGEDERGDEREEEKNSENESEVRLDEERSDELLTLALRKKTTRAYPFMQDAPLPQPPLLFSPIIPTPFAIHFAHRRTRTRKKIALLPPPQLQPPPLPRPPLPLSTTKNLPLSTSRPHLFLPTLPSSSLMVMEECFTTTPRRTSTPLTQKLGLSFSTPSLTRLIRGFLR